MTTATKETEMKTTTIQSKEELIAHILTSEAYKDSGLLARTAAKLMILPLSTLQDLDLLLIFRIKESEELDRKVQKILAK